MKGRGRSITANVFFVSKTTTKSGLNSDPFLILIYLIIKKASQLGSPIKQEDPPNLSILLSGGKETNKDSLSNGE